MPEVANGFHNSIAKPFVINTVEESLTDAAWDFWS